MNQPPFKPSDINVQLGLGGTFVQNHNAEITANNIVILSQANNNTWLDPFTKAEYLEKMNSNSTTNKFFWRENDEGLKRLVSSSCLAFNETNERYTIVERFFTLIEPNKW
ncbi:MAG: hypothetical protein WCL18_02770 [bacterium]